MSTGGTIDSANRYSGVGMIAFYGDGGRYRCSATLVSPTVLLTAAHCTSGVEGKTAVMFAVLVDDAPPSNLPAASSPAAGYTLKDLAGTGYVSGTAVTHPDYSDFTDLDNWNDVGVVVLDAPVTNVAITPIADEGTLDRIPRRDLRSTIFRAVGYGTEVRKAETGRQRERQRRHGRHLLRRLRWPAPPRRRDRRGSRATATPPTAATSTATSASRSASSRIGSPASASEPAVLAVFARSP